MTDRMTERFDTPQVPGSANTDLPAGGAADLGATAGASETVTHSAAVDEVTVGQAAGSSGDAGAKDHASAVAQDAKESTKGVASTAASEAKDVAHEAKTQLRQLVDQLGSEATDQASGQTQRAVGGLRSLSSELSDMAQSQQGESGMATDLARQGASRLDAAANWLEGRQPGEILDEVRSFARRRPGAFLAGAAILGIVGGRMTRGLTGESSGSSDDRSSAPVGSSGAAYGGPTAQAGVQPGVPSNYGSGAPVGTGSTSVGGDTAYAADPLDLEGTDPNRGDAGIDPATHTHPRTATGVSGGSR